MQILAVSADNHEESKKFGEMLRKRFDGEFDFPLLEDKEHKVIDPKGAVRWKFIEVDYKKRPSNEQIRQQLAKIK